MSQEEQQATNAAVNWTGSGTPDSRPPAVNPHGGHPGMGHHGGYHGGYHG
ncbi:MAG: hypothetical protein K0Q94_6281, partial [Paenibacillus sp.]|nr:hypothetical protein [Paenibacillus sp.]